MLRLLRWVRPVLRWLFAVEALVLFANVVSSFSRPFQPHVLSLPLRMWAFHAAVLAVSLLFAAAWWTTRQRPAKRNVFAIAACLILIGEAALILYIDRDFQLGFAAFNVILLLGGIFGVVAFSGSETGAAPVPGKVRPIAGDRTNPWVNKALFALLYIAIWSGTGFWYRFGWQHGFPHYSFVPDILFITIACLINATLHECGHALTAFAFKMKLLAFNAGPLQWRRVQGKWKFNLNLAGLFGGAVAVVPTHPDPPEGHDACVLVAGPLTNFMTAPFFLWATLHVEGTRFQSAWLLLAYLATFSIADAVFNLLPIRTKEGAYSDGARLLQLLTHSPIVPYLRAMARLQSTLVTPLRARDLDPVPLQQAAALRSQELSGLHLHLCVAQIFEDLGRIPEATASIAAAEAIYDSNSLDLPAALHTVFVYFHACRNRNAVAARLWWDRMQAKKIQRQNIDYWLACSALGWIEGRSADAEEAWRKADAEAQTLPPFGAYEFDRDRAALLRHLLDGPIPEPVAITTRVAPPCAVGPDPSLLRAANRRALLIVSGISIVLLIGIVGLKFRSYASAIVWHCRHGNIAQVGSYTVRLPIPWRAIDDPEDGFQSLQRAGISAFYLQPKITLMPADRDDSPASDEDTDRRALIYAKEYVARVNKGYSSKGWSASLVVLQPKPFPLVCERLDYSRPGLAPSTQMYCRVSHNGDTLLYTGPASREPEAESILSTIQESPSSPRSPGKARLDNPSTPTQ